MIRSFPPVCITVIDYYHWNNIDLDLNSTIITGCAAITIIFVRSYQLTVTAKFTNDRIFFVKYFILGFKNISFKKLFSRICLFFPILVTQKQIKYNIWNQSNKTNSDEGKEGSLTPKSQTRPGMDEVKSNACLLEHGGQRD